MGFEVHGGQAKDIRNAPTAGQSMRRWYSVNANGSRVAKRWGLGIQGMTMMAFQSRSNARSRKVGAIGIKISIFGVK